MIGIFDDDQSARASTAALLEGAGYEVRAFESGDAFLAGQLPDDFDCVVLDLHLTGTDGAGVLAELNDRESMPPVLVLTRPGGIAEAVQAMKLGATDFFEKPYEADSLLQAISLALTSGPRKKGSAIDPEAAAKLSTLSKRQLDVLTGILRGLQNKIIAYELSLSIRTVETYRAQVLVKLGVRGTAEAVRLAIAAGMLESI
jgi:two-component system response regulator FixJ